MSQDFGASWVDLDPRVGAVVYRRTDTGTIYALAQNGYSPFYSNDLGMSFYEYNTVQYTVCTVQYKNFPFPVNANTLYYVLCNYDIKL